MHHLLALLPLNQHSQQLWVGALEVTGILQHMAIPVQHTVLRRMLLHLETRMEHSMPNMWRRQWTRMLQPWQHTACTIPARPR